MLVSNLKSKVQCLLGVSDETQEQLKKAHELRKSIRQRLEERYSDAAKHVTLKGNGKVTEHG
jgi:hypothetical protein